MTNHPYGAVSKTFVGSSGWMEGLPFATEDWANGTSGSERKRWTWANWTQDDTNLTEINNPRVVESRVGDATNIKRSTTEYRTIPLTNIAEYGLVSAVYVYDTDQSTILKKVETDYNLSSAYLSRRIIGLPSEVRAYGRENSSLNLVSKATYQYDEGDFSDTNLVQNISTVIQHDNSSFSASFMTGRGNLTSVTRYDVTGQTASVTSQTKYNTAGAPVSRIDPTGREVKISYADNFNDTTTNRNTFAYPTKLTDPASHFSEVKYRFDIGANVWAKSPAPAGNSIGKESVREFDSVGRLLKETIVNNGAYTRYEYPTNGIQSKVYTTIIDASGDGADSTDEVLSESWTDGAGRVRQSRTEHPNSSGGFKGFLAEYDILGRVKRSTTPAEINSSWTPAGDDAAGWLWTSKEFDWKGRVIREVNTDGTDRLMSYEGCGCAGGQVTTIQSEFVPRDDQPTVNARRTQKIYDDILGRTWKTEVMNWDGVTPYTTTVQTFNGRDQITNTRQYSGSTSSSTYQDVTMTYDGHGRMKTRHYPIEDANTYTTWNYNSDDTIHEIVDPRSAITSFTYNNLGLTSQISYSVPSGSTIPVTPTVTFAYDDLGNRTSMTDGTGTTTYTYNDLSQLLSETKQFTDSLPNAPLSNNKFKIDYTYNLSGGIKSITDPYGSVINYTNDKTGRLTAVSGSAWAQNTTGNYASNIKYRAWGAIKQMDYTPPTDNEQIKMEYDNRLRVSHYEYTSSSQTSGYVMKSDFSYLADSRTQAKNDLLNDAWDRTMQYDQAGRLVYNQFGMGSATGGGTARVYEQEIQYDGFSQMTSRMITHWGNDGGGFSATYVNGRKQDSTLSFDASGNIIAENHAINEFQNTTFDSAGRRTAHLERWHTNNGPQSTFIVWENKTEQVFDGDGRPTIEKRGMRRMNQEVVPPMTTSPYLYHIWSSVLGAVLTKAENTGRKLETNVFAGGTVIAKQTRYTENGQNYDNIGWTSADPVTSTTGGIGYLNSASSISTQDYEPLGQTIAQNDPSEEPEPSYQTHVGSVDFPEWQCQLPENFLPIDCKMKQEILDSINGTSIKTIYDPEKKPGDPSFVHADDPPATSEAEARDDHLMHETTHATTKPVNVSNTGAAVQPSQVPNETGENDNDTIYGDANGTSYVTVRGGPSLPVDFEDVGVGGKISLGRGRRDVNQASIISQTRAVLTKATEDTNSPCAKLFSKKGIKKSLELFEKMLKDGKISVADTQILIKNDAGDVVEVALSTQPQIEGWYDKKEKAIYLNPSGRTIKNLMSQKEREDPNNIRNQYEQLDLISAILIHEILHATGDFDSDGDNPKKSADYSKQVLEACFTKKEVKKSDK